MTSRAVVGEEFASVLAAARTGADWAWKVLYESLAPTIAGYLRARGAPDPDTDHENGPPKALHGITAS